MIDDLSTRAAMTMGAFLLLATGLSVLSLSSGSEILESARDLARHVARELDAIGRMTAEVSLLFGPNGTARVRLPVELGAAPYRLEVRATDVRVVAEGLSAVEPLRVRVHPFAPDRAAYSEEELRERDEGGFGVSSGESVRVVRTARLVDGTFRFLTFAFTE